MHSVFGNAPVHYQRIDEMFVFVVDEGKGEGVPAMQVGQVWMPLVGADKFAVENMRACAQHICNEMKQPMKLLHFSTRTVLETLQPH
ncbi:MAG TPA: hypothetical protein VGH74_01235 [Planctomycetaceae bacterium]|jgi:hypothetical protein